MDILFYFVIYWIIALPVAMLIARRLHRASPTKSSTPSTPSTSGGINVSSTDALWDQSSRTGQVPSTVSGSDSRSNVRVKTADKPSGTTKMPISENS